MSTLVLKFGGTSVGSIERIQQAADIVIDAKRAGHNVCVVVSAMSGETDRLISLFKQIDVDPPTREYAALVSTGEQVSMALMAMALQHRGFSAKSFTGLQAKIITDDMHAKARILSIDTTIICKALNEGCIPVVAGFQGVSVFGEITTLGRGGSDTSAVAIAAAIPADECQIYTDVDGVYTTDPRVVPEARRLDKITFEEMLEMSSLGAKVLQIRAVELAGKYNVPLRVLSTFKPGPGTLITYEDNDMEKPIVSGVAFNRNEAKLSLVGVPDTPGIAHRILGPIGKAGIDIDMIVQNVADAGKTTFTFTVHRDDFDKALEILEKTAVDLDAAKVIGNRKIAKISLVGVGMRSHSGVASTMFETLAAEAINIQMITTSEIKISVIVDEKYLELGVRALHQAFNLAADATEEFDPHR